MSKYILQTSLTLVSIDHLAALSQNVTIIFLTSLL